MIQKVYHPRADLKDLIANQIKAGSKAKDIQRKYKVSSSFIYTAMYDHGIKYRDLLDERRKRTVELNFANVLTLKEKLNKFPAADEIKMVLISRESPFIYIDKLHKHFNTGKYKEKAARYEKGITSSVKILAEKKEELLNEIEKVAVHLGHLPNVREIKLHSKYFYKEYLKYFGSYQIALKQSPPKLQIKEKRKSLKEEEKRKVLLNYFMDRSRELGRIPRKKDLNNTSFYNYMHYYRAFGGYKKTLKAAALFYHFQRITSQKKELEQ